jgi:hypothetical protein
MTRPSFFTFRRTVVATVLLIAAGFAIAALFAPSTEAAPSGSCTYYNNANYTNVVGQYGYDCCNNKVAWGRKTQYFVCGGCFPCTPPPRD